MRAVSWGGVLDGNAGLAGIPVTSSFQTLSAVCSGKILVFIQYIISIYCRSCGSPVQTLTTKGLQRTANEYAEERRIYKDLISKNNNVDILNSASRILQC